MRDEKDISFGLWPYLAAISFDFLFIMSMCCRACSFASLCVISPARSKHLIIFIESIGLIYIQYRSLRNITSEIIFKGKEIEWDKTDG